MLTPNNNSNNNNNNSSVEDDKLIKMIHRTRADSPSNTNITGSSPTNHHHHRHHHHHHHRPYDLLNSPPRQEQPKAPIAKSMISMRPMLLLPEEFQERRSMRILLPKDEDTPEANWLLDIFDPDVTNMNNSNMM